MSRAHGHPVINPASTAHSMALLADPIDPLAEQVGKAVAAEMKQFSTLAPAKGVKKAASSDVVGAAELRELEARISVVVANVLGRSLASPTAEGRALRMTLIAKLANAEIDGNISTEPAKPPASDVLLTTAETAARLEVSRPYVSMLCDQNKLGEIVMTEGGHRRIRSSAVDAYLSARIRQHEGAMSPRQAALEAGLYDFPEGHFKNIVRNHPTTNAPAKTVKAARRPRS